MDSDWCTSYTIGKVFVWRISCKGAIIEQHFFTCKNIVWCLKILSEGFRPRLTKLGLANKNGRVSWSLHVFHSRCIKMDEKHYNDPIWIIPPQFRRILVPKIFYLMRSSNFSLTFSLVYHLALLRSCAFNPIFQRSLYPCLVVLDIFCKNISSFNSA